MKETLKRGTEYKNTQNVSLSDILNEIMCDYENFENDIDVLLDKLNKSNLL